MDNQNLYNSDEFVSPWEAPDDPADWMRVQSARKKRRVIKLDRDRNLIALYKELRKLSKQVRNLGYEDLNPPVQRGWKRSFVLRPDVATGTDANLFQSILEKINTKHYSWRKDFKEKRRRRGKKIYVVSVQELEKLPPYKFDKAGFSETEKTYFHLTLTYGSNAHLPEWIYVFKEPWRYELRIQPNIITRTRIRDFALEQRIAGIEQFLEWNNQWPYLQKLLHGHYKWRHRWIDGEAEKYRSPLTNKSLAEILEEYWPEQLEQNNTNPQIDWGFCFLRMTSNSAESSNQPRTPLKISNSTTARSCLIF